MAFLILWHHRFQKVPFSRVYTKTRKQRYHTWAQRFRKVPFLYNTQIFWSRLPFPRNNLTAFLRRWKLFEGCYRMTQIPESSVQKLEDRLNNNGCINFCRDKAFPLAATSNKQCVCLNSLPTTLLAISTDGDAASGPSSSCNIKCPGDAGESCFRTSCCGGPEQAYSIYATGGEWCVIQLKITPRRSRRVVKKISATLKKVVQEVMRGEGINFLFIVRSEDIDIITFAIAFCSWAILDELKHLGPWIMIVSLRQCARSFSSWWSSGHLQTWVVNIRKKKKIQVSPQFL